MFDLSKKHDGLWSKEFWSRAVDVLECPDGPLLVRRGGTLPLDDQGKGRRVVAVCRCEKSALFPLCDGTHKTLTSRMRAG